MYLSWAKKTVTDFSDKNIDNLYDQGFVFTRVGRGIMNQTRSLRVDLSAFALSSENRRVLKKTENVKITKFSVPYDDYSWTVGKLGKDFYETKFGEGTFSANKMKELMTDAAKSNFTIVFLYENDDVEKIGYCIALETASILHYCYPFYKLDTTIPNLGLGMMLKAIEWAQKNGKKYAYLGSFQRPTDTYKLQFEGLEWFDEQNWQTDLSKLKTVLKIV
ncbi:MAG: hypothetical protein A3I29_04850 [Candidatus Magasanikbacteria bacterium RIFCSPLOWO2_02_FULL_44_11]|uniref:N-end rule aminoacyl transferase C-terminal domain-containing protein n=2 Tax=Candidatus Magasanikiibacteriota TaxID=1752731 RepID=A0A1F6NBJ1_9BACT|nr:MAG: hypothetical protein A3D53_00770 [Candidatus Magasanikbacteria bacterium RIFCSPHIGHO2_02_FULL_45_10]OGH81287.1 MAG: hypothetical protein A3I29_04850 [Candidatus Magasanikbacteria bacterium RIFCSPLOWO2_02_FULL_44_11]